MNELASGGQLLNTLADVLILLILIVSGATRCVYNEGMPIYRNPFEKGNLYIKFELTFPPNQFANEKQLKVCMNKTCFLKRTFLRE